MPPPKSMLRAVLERLRDARYLAADVGYQLGRGPRLLGRGARALGRAVSGAWFSRSLAARRRIAGAVAAVAIVAAAVLVARPAIPCGLPGAEECQPVEEARALVPADALIYASIVTDTDFDQLERAVELASDMPQLTRQVYGRVLAALPGPGGAPPSVERDLSDWLGDELAIAVMPTHPQRPSEVVMFSVADREGAERYAEAVAVGSTEEVDVADRTILVDARDQATVIVDDFLLVGPRDGVERIVGLGQPAADDEPEAPADLDDQEAGEDEADQAQGAEDAGGVEEEAATDDRLTLADDPQASAVLEALPEPRLLTAYVSRQGARRLTGPGATLAPFEPLIDSGATEGAAIALSFDDDAALELDVHSALDPERASGFFAAFPRFSPSLDDALGDGTLAYVGFGDPAETLARLLEQATAGEAEGLAGALQDLGRRLRRLARIDVTAELLPALGTEAALAIEPGGELETVAPARPGDEDGERGEDEDEDEERADGAEDAQEEDAEGPAEPQEPEPEPETPEGADPLAGEQPIPLLSLLVDGVDAEAVSEVLSELQGPLARALAPEDADRVPSFRGLDVDGTEVQAMRLTPVIELAYAVVGDLLTIATGPVAIQRQARGESGLTTSERFERAMDGLTAQTSFTGFLDLFGLIAVAEREGLAADPVYAPFAEEVRRLEAFGLSVDAGDGELTSALRLILVR